MTSDLIVSDYFELLSLHRALMEAKFNNMPNDYDVIKSPIVGKLHSRIIELLIHIDCERKGEEQKQKWMSWLEVDVERREWRLALNATTRESRWRQMGREEKLTYITVLFDPLIINEKLRLEFLREAESLQRK